MKFSSSSTSSASSTITTSSYGSPSDSKNTAAGCVSGVLRRLLCGNSLPVQPSDHLEELSCDPTERENSECPCEEVKDCAMATPGIVARLMGLDSLPQTDLDDGKKFPGLITRSRSLNSVDSLKELGRIETGHRRASSFREIPTYLELEDEKFFILSFEKDGASREFSMRRKKYDLGSEELKQRRESKYNGESRRSEEKNGQGKENQDPNNVINKLLNDIISGSAEDSAVKNSDRNSIMRMDLVNCKNGPEGGRLRRRKKKKNNKNEEFLAVRRSETECSSENSSPNSVLDFTEFAADSEVHTSEEKSGLANPKLRRTLWEEIENYRNLDPCKKKGSVKQSSKSKRSEKEEQLLVAHTDFKDQKYVEIWNEVCMLVEKETRKPNWMQKEIWKLEDYKEIGGKITYRILDDLLNELVIHLSEANLWLLYL